MNMCVLSLDVVMTSLINKEFQIMVLKVCMLHMKYKIYRYYGYVCQFRISYK